ncbi:MAG: putative alpha/beta hydrolase [Paraglaciecola sp.]|jgi:predicted alpha/beta hydrolase
MQPLSINTQDQQILQGYRFSPATPGKGRIVIAPAMGITQAFYRPLATWLAEQGFTVITFDYRGMGESCTQPLRFQQHNILDWAQYDCSAALAEVLKAKAPEPIYWLGHSLGGQIFPLVEQIDKVSKVITVSSGTGYWRHNAPPLKNKALLFWYLIMPVATAVYGYFPGKKLGIVGDLPKNVIRQWRRWCLHPQYCAGVEAADVRDKFTDVQVTIDSLAFSDDEMLSLRNMQDLQALFGSATKQLITIEPASLGIARIGHLGFFRKEFSHNLWPKILLPRLAL